jgi:hypothetical protein
MEMQGGGKNSLNEVIFFEKDVLAVQVH